MYLSITSPVPEMTDDAWASMLGFPRLRKPSLHDGMMVSNILLPVTSAFHLHFMDINAGISSHPYSK